MGKKIGIDLGTSNSMAAIHGGKRPEVLLNREGKGQTPSVVGLKKRKGKKGNNPGELLVGETAYEFFPMAPKDTILSIKRLMGKGIGDSEVNRVQKEFLYKVVQPSDGTRDSIRVVMDDEEYSPIDISSMILKKMKEDAEYRLNEEVTHAVITVPAYFGQLQKDATYRAATKAGLKVIALLDEPTAAAIAFGLDSGDDSSAKTILVYDFGGGTFDISVLMWAGNVFAPLNLEGDMWLGGDNLDQELINHIIEHIKEEYKIDPASNMRFMAELKKKARNAKERLSSSQIVDIIIPGLLQDGDGDLIDVDLEVTRNEFNRMIRPHVARTISLVEKAIENANLTKDQIDFVLMAGNSTNVPLVQEEMEKLFGSGKIMRNIHPKHCVALGAATLAARCGEEIICYGTSPQNMDRVCGHKNPSNATHCEKCGKPLEPSEEPGKEVSGPTIEVGTVAPYHYGTQSKGDRFNIFIKNGDSTPTEPDDIRIRTFQTTVPDMRMIMIPVYGGDRLEKASANTKQGEVLATLPPGLPKGTPVHIKLWLNDMGVFDLTAQLDNGLDLNPMILRGEIDQKTAEILFAMVSKLEENIHELLPEHANEAKKLKDEAFRALDKKDYDGAINAANKIDEIIEKGKVPTEKVSPEEQLINLVDFILSEYKWALDPDISYSLANIKTELKNAMDNNDTAAMREKYDALNEEVNKTPPEVWAILNLRGTIVGLKDRFPKEADELMNDLKEVENAFKAGDKPGALAKFGEVAQKADKLTKKTGSAPVGMRCPECKAEAKGAIYCPKCGAPIYIVANKQSSASSSQHIKL